MNETLVLGLIVLVLWALVTYWRVPAVVLLSSILIGKLLADELSPDVYGVISGVLPALSSQMLQAGLLILPVALTILFLKGTSPKSMMLFNAVPLLLCLVTLCLFVNPYFDVVGRLDEQQRVILTDNQSYIVSFAGVLTLISAWIPHFKKADKHKKGKKH